MYTTDDVFLKTKSELFKLEYSLQYHTRIDVVSSSLSKSELSKYVLFDVVSAHYLKVSSSITQLYSDSNLRFYRTAFN